MFYGIAFCMNDEVVIQWGQGGLSEQIPLKGISTPIFEGRTRSDVFCMIFSQTSTRAMEKGRLLHYLVNLPLERVIFSQKDENVYAA